MDWHRLFGLVLTDFFTGSPFLVELETDLSLKQQYLDVVIIRRGKGRFQDRLPDGLDDLADHNLITFKSHHEALDDWALMELTGHFVNYRKQVSLRPRKLLPAAVFRLYAICSSYPHNLANEVPLEPVQEGVYNCRRGTNLIRIIVAIQLPKTENNAPLHLFSHKADKVGYGAQHYRRRSENTSSVIEDVFQGYSHEGAVMPYTMQDFQRDYAKRHYMDLTPQERREMFARLSPAEQREMVAGLSPTERREMLAALSVEELLESLPREKIDQLLRQEREKQSTKKRSRRG